MYFKYKIRLASWNIDSLTDRFAESVDAMIKQNVSILCVQEIKWVGEKIKIMQP